MLERLLFVGGELEVGMGVLVGMTAFPTVRSSKLVMVVIVKESVGLLCKTTTEAL